MEQTRVELYHGDCLEVMPVLAAGSVAMVFADLPYGITRNVWDLPVPLEAFWGCANNVCTINAAKVLTACMPFGGFLMASNIKEFRYDLVWHKTNSATGFLNAKRMPLRNHEHLLVFYSKLPSYTPQMKAGKPYRVAPCKVSANSKNYGHHVEKLRTNKGTRFPCSVLPFKSELGKTRHPTQKPVALLEWLIKTYTNPGDTVLDPVMGSGTTGVACKRLGRHFIGIEKDATYFAAAKSRIDAEPWPVAALAP